MKILVANLKQADFWQSIRQDGNAVVCYPHGGDADLPTVSQSGLAGAARVADLVIVDTPFPLTRTRRSYKPSQDALFFDEMRRHHRVLALGPTPTIDLLVGDQRYLRKMCLRFAVPYAPEGEGGPWLSGAWFRGNTVLPCGPFLDAWVPLFKSVGFRGWFSMVGALTPEGPVVSQVDATWADDTIPEGKRIDFLKGMMK